MSLQFIIGSSGAGKSYFAYERVIRESMEHPERNSPGKRNPEY